MNEIATLRLILQTEGSLPALIWGDFGVGKTSRIVQLAHSLGMDVEILRPAERGEGALGVVPVPSEDRKVLNYPLPDWAARLASGERQGLLFLDEVSSTPPALQPAIMGLLLDGVIAGQRLPASVKRVAAANPVDQAAGGWDLAPALANRVVHLHWGCPSPSEWGDWLMSLPGESSSWAKARSLAAAFVRAHPQCLHEDVAKVLGRTPPAYATPRTWETATRLLAACMETSQMALYPGLAQGALGPAVALEGAEGDPAGAWLVWLKDNDLPDPETLLKDPDQFEHDPRRPDRTYATLLAVAEAGLATTNGRRLSEATRSTRWNQAWEVMKRGLDADIGKDVVLLPCRRLVNAKGRPAGRPGPAAQVVAEELVLLLDHVELQTKKPSMGSQ